MKIAFIIGNLYGGGAERVVSILANQMAADNNDVSIIVIASMKSAYTLSPRVNVVDCTKSISTKGLSFFYRVKIIRDAIKNIRPDICISFTVGVNIYSVLSAIGVKTKLILAERNDPRYDPVSKVGRVLRRVLYRHADGYVFQTAGERNFFPPSIQRKSVVIPNPVNPDLPEPYNGEREKRFVSVSRLSPQKNITMAIDAFCRATKNHPNYTYDIYGDGPLYQEISEYIQQLDDGFRINLRGSSSDVFHEIERAYGFILSSNYEGISNSMLEAMALGIPTISTDYPSGGARENIVDGENGILVPVGDVDSLENAIKSLIDKPEWANEIARNAIKIRERLAVGIITMQWIDYIQNVVSDQKRG